MSVHTTPTSATSWSPDLITFDPQDVIPEALILQTSTVAGSVEGDAPAVRVPYVDDAEADFVAEGDEIPESDPVLAETTVYTGKVSQLIRISREQWMQTNAANLLSTSVERAVTNRANLAYIAQVAPTTGTTPPAGILHTAGVIQGDPIGDDLDPLADALAAIEAANGAPTHIIASPTAWSHLRKLKVATGSHEMLLGAGNGDAEKRVFNLPTLVSPAVPAGELVVLDSTAVLSAVGQVQVSTSEHVFFSSDSIALRCTWRFGQQTVRPDRIAHLAITTEA